MSGISFRDLDPHDQALAATMNDCAIDFPSGSSELEATGLKTLPSVDIA